MSGPLYVIAGVGVLFAILLAVLVVLETWNAGRKGT